jgi:hypothetical protein
LFEQNRYRHFILLFSDSNMIFPDV